MARNEKILTQVHGFRFEFGVNVPFSERQVE
jgi:hypothetical protein